MVQLSIDEQAVRNFADSFCPFIIEDIGTYYNPDFLIHFSPLTYSFSFLQKDVIVYTLKEKTVLAIDRIDYKSLIPDSFLLKLLNMEYTPSRLKRYRRIGLERLRWELADELMLGGIIVKEKNAIWEDYQLVIKISPGLQMEQIEK